MHYSNKHSTVISVAYYYILTLHNNSLRVVNKTAFADAFVPAVSALGRAECPLAPAVPTPLIQFSHSIYILQLAYFWATITYPIKLELIRPAGLYVKLRDVCKHRSIAGAMQPLRHTALS